jgi:hypothetical protein
MPDEGIELHRIISPSVRDILDAYRIHAQAGPASDKAFGEIIFRAAHPVPRGGRGRGGRGWPARRRAPARRLAGAKL